MKEFEGIKLTEREPFAKFALVFRSADEPSQDICFQTEEECNKVLSEIIEGKGIKLEYEIRRSEDSRIWTEEVRMFPNWIVKVQFQNEYSIFDSITDEMRETWKKNGFEPEFKFPKHISRNPYQPRLVEKDPWINTSKELPPKGTDILATDGKSIVSCKIEGDSAGNWMMPVGFNGDEYSFDFSYEEIIQWMPLPKLHK